MLAKQRAAKPAPSSARKETYEEEKHLRVRRKPGRFGFDRSCRTMRGRPFKSRITFERELLQGPEHESRGFPIWRVPALVERLRMNRGSGRVNLLRLPVSAIRALLEDSRADRLTIEELPEKRRTIAVERWLSVPESPNASARTLEEFAAWSGFGKPEDDV